MATVIQPSTKDSEEHPYRYFIRPGDLYKYLLIAENKKTKGISIILCTDSYSKVIDRIDDLRSKKIGVYL